jgi:hypothetical protein
MSWKPEVIADASGKWADNALRFATREEAQAWADDLALRWIAVREARATECDDPVSHRLIGSRAMPLDNLRPNV